MSGGRDFLDGQRSCDPIKVVRHTLKRALPRRFYREASVVEKDGLFAVALDGRLVKTPARIDLAISSPLLAAAIAREWRGQGEHIDPATMPITRIANSALDGVFREPEAVIEDVIRYAGFDLLCHRAVEPQSLARRQGQVWDPPLDWAAAALGARLMVGTGISSIHQPPEALAAIMAAVRPLCALQLAALHVITTLTGSAILALAVLKRALTPEAAWVAAHIDEDHQSALWGIDEEARLRRVARWQDMDAAAQTLALLD